MGLASAVAGFLKQVTFSVYGVPVLSFDCSISESHSRDSMITEFEVENGQTISDHIVIKPFHLKLTGVISDSPLSGIGAIATNVATTAITKIPPNPGVLSGASKALAALSLLPNPFSPSKDAYSALLDLQAARIPLTVTTSIKIYFNMWIKSISVPRDSKTGGGLTFDVDLAQLLLVTPIQVDIAIFAKADLAASAANKGAESSTIASEAAAAFAAGANASSNAVGAGDAVNATDLP